MIQELTVACIHLIADILVEDCGSLAGILDNGDNFDVFGHFFNEAERNAERVSYHDRLHRLVLRYWANIACRRIC